MSIWSYKAVAILPILASALTGCLSTKPYQPPKGAATATLIYEIDPASFYSPTYFVKNGYKERVDIQLLPSPLSVALAVNSKEKTVYMNFGQPEGFHEINTFEANKKLRFSYQHKMVKGLGEWPLLCLNSITTELEANKKYILKAKTIVENKRTEKSILGIQIEKEDTSCQIQIVDIQTNTVVANSGMVLFKK